MKNTPARLVYFDRFSHPVALEMLQSRAHIEPRRLEPGQDPQRLLQEFSEAHVYQIRATRSELSEAYFANANLLRNCPNLLAVSTNGSGADTVDIPACTAAGVLVVNQAGGNKEAVAEHALGMMLVLSKRIGEADRAVRSIPGLQRETLMGHDIFGKTLGIIGLGHIGRRLCQLVRDVFQMKVMAFDPYIGDEVFTACGAEKSPLESRHSPACRRTPTS